MTRRRERTALALLAAALLLLALLLGRMEAGGEAGPAGALFAAAKGAESLCA